ncbi:MAG TPA: IS256 family transposase [Candidatus Acidoferrales bacterium]|nr:IS256 family transposase [Candidatus Acidoferrales bacterium]
MDRDVVAWLRQELQEAHPDLLREMLGSMVGELMGAEAQALCGADFGERSSERTNSRNGYREREWDTRAGTLPLAIPKLRQGSYFPNWLLEPRRRAERALVNVIAQAYVAGVSTRRVEGLIQTLGIAGISKSQVSVMAKSLDGMVDEFRNRPLDGGPYTYIWVDALTQRCRDGGRVVNVCTAIATAVNADGQREILGVDVFTAEDGAAWTSFLRGLVARGLTGVRLVISDDHLGLKQSIAAVLPGAGWQRCRVHFVRNLLTRVPKSAQTLVATLVRSIFAQPDLEAVWAQHGRMVEQLTERFPAAAELLAEAGPDVLAFATFPREHWRQIWSNNPQERLNREVRRRTDVVGIFPDRAAVVRLVGAVLAEQHDEWLVARRYLSAESLKAAQMAISEPKEVTPALAAAS